MLEAQQTQDSVLQINHAYTYNYKTFKEVISQIFPVKTIKQSCIQIIKILEYVKIHKI
jgi:hypothetical protein